MSGGSNSVGAYQVGTWTFTGTLSGNVAVTNWPASFGASQDGAWTVAVNNFPASFPVTGNVAATQ